MSAPNVPMNPMSAWSRLRALLCCSREEMGLRQSDVARLGAFGLRSLERWENGDSEPGAFAMFRWCSVLRVNLNAVLLELAVAESKSASASTDGRTVAPEGV